MQAQRELFKHNRICEVCIWVGLDVHAASDVNTVSASVCEADIAIHDPLLIFGNVWVEDIKEIIES